LFFVPWEIQGILYRVVVAGRATLHLLPATDHPKHCDLVLKGLISEHGNKRPFRVIEVELAFLCDFFYTGCPIIFSKGFPVFNIVLILVVGATCWLAVAILARFKYPTGGLSILSMGSMWVRLSPFCF